MKLDVLPARATATTGGDDPLIDQEGRRVGYLRLSLTAACAMRCLYCRPAKLSAPNNRAHLTPGEIERLVSHLVRRYGLHKVRLTGGDPTSRPDLVDIIGRLASIPELQDLAMTTHGLTLARQADAYAQAGLGRINVSLDTLDAERFEQMTGVAGLSRVLDGIEAAEAAGLGPVKLNAVVVRNRNEQDLTGLVRYAAARQLELRFIELMPMGPLASVWSQRYVSAARARRRIEPITRRWQALPQGSDSATRYRVTLDDRRTVTIGFITPMSCNFCEACNRIRITSDGVLYPCLMDAPGPTLLPALRPTFDPGRLDQLLRAGLEHKMAEHPHDGAAVMTHIGG